MISPFDDAQSLASWPRFLASGVLVLVRVSGLMVFAPLFNSQAVAARIKAGFAIATTVLLAPAVAAVPNARPVLDVPALLGELGVGLCFGLSLALLLEAIGFAAALLGQSFSFSLVNLLDPNTRVDTAVLGVMLNWFTLLVLIAAGLDRTLLAALFRSFAAVPVGRGVLLASTGAAIVSMASGIFLAGLQLAAPVMAAGLAVEMTVAMVGRLAPQLPAMVIGVPLKTLVSYVVLLASLAVWPCWIEHHFTGLLDSAAKLLAPA